MKFKNPGTVPEKNRKMEDNPVRTSLHIDRSLYAEIVAEGVRRDMTFKEIADDALRCWLENNKR